MQLRVLAESARGERDVRFQLHSQTSACEAPAGHGPWGQCRLLGLRATSPSVCAMIDSDMNKPAPSRTATKMSRTRNCEQQLRGVQLGQAMMNGSFGGSRFENIVVGPRARTTRCISEEQELPRKTLRIQTGTMELEGQCLNEHANMRARITACRPTRTARRVLLPKTRNGQVYRGLWRGA
ncbi:hypothetical protein HWV62_23366 [Athelia sp. TMB]|nr:hypothetical protein HWV62_23366 [Athelia sp. TMB]